jgi:hypothetical protein
MMPDSPLSFLSSATDAVRSATDAARTVIALEPFWFAVPSAALGGLVGGLGSTSLLEGAGLVVLGGLVGLVGWGMIRHAERARDENRRHHAGWVARPSWIAVAWAAHASLTPVLVDAPLPWILGWGALPILAGLAFAIWALVVTVGELRRGPDRIGEPTG